AANRPWPRPAAKTRQSWKKRSAWRATWYANVWQDDSLRVNHWVVYGVKAPQKPDLETDPRFPSGPWTGYFLQPAVPGRHMMELLLTFSKGQLTGEGRDRFGVFILRGQYFLADGKCHWTKRYIGKHDVFYQGFNEGKGIWGVWEIAATQEYGGQRGGVHIWPQGMSDPSRSHLTEEAELPIPAKEGAESEKRVAEPVGSRLRRK